MPPIVIRRPLIATSRPGVSLPRRWTGCRIVDQDRIRLCQHLPLTLDIGVREGLGRGIEPDRENVEADAAAQVLPAAAAEIERSRPRHSGDGGGAGQPRARELPGLRLELIVPRSEQQVEPHMVVDQHPALRPREEEAELEKHQQDGDEDSYVREAGAALLVNVNRARKVRAGG